MNKELSPLERVLARLVHNLMSTENAEQCDKDIKTLKFALKDYENLQLKHKSMQDAVLDDFKKLKALEIIKEKTNLTKTNDGKKALVFVILEDQEEFDLLKEVL